MAWRIRRGRFLYKDPPTCSKTWMFLVWVQVWNISSPYWIHSERAAIASDGYYTRGCGKVSDTAMILSETMIGKSCPRCNQPYALCKRVLGDGSPWCECGMLNSSGYNDKLFTLHNIIDNHCIQWRVNFYNDGCFLCPSTEIDPINAFQATEEETKLPWLPYTITREQLEKYLVLVWFLSFLLDTALVAIHAGGDMILNVKYQHMMPSVYAVWSLIWMVWQRCCVSTSGQWQ